MKSQIKFSEKCSIIKDIQHIGSNGIKFYFGHEVSRIFTKELCDFRLEEKTSKRWIWRINFVQIYSEYQHKISWLFRHKLQLSTDWIHVSTTHFLPHHGSFIRGSQPTITYRNLENQLTRKMYDDVKVSLQFRKVVARFKRRQI